MSAADARENVEAAIWQAMAMAVGDPKGTYGSWVDEAMKRADAYAQAFADERAAGRERLAQATAERTGRPA